MTCRRLEQRIGEHSTSVSSAVLQHMTSLGHDVAFNDPQGLAHDNNRFRLGIKETLNIHSYKAYKSLNKNTGSYGPFSVKGLNCKVFVSKALPVNLSSFRHQIL